MSWLDFALGFVWGAVVGATVYYIRRDRSQIVRIADHEERTAWRIFELEEAIRDIQCGQLYESEPGNTVKITRASFQRALAAIGESSCATPEPPEAA